MFTKTIRVKLHERVVIFKDGLLVRVYGPGRHRLWGLRLSEQRWDTTKLVFGALPEVRALLPNEHGAGRYLGYPAAGKRYLGLGYKSGSYG
jgi:hypothetical protein